MRTSIKIFMINFIKGHLKQGGSEEMKEVVIKKALEDSKPLGLSLILINCSIIVGAGALAAFAFVLLRSFSLPSTLSLPLVAILFLALSLFTLLRSIHFIQEKVRFYQSLSQTKKSFNFSFLSPLLLELKEEQRRMKNRYQ